MIHGDTKGPNVAALIVILVFDYFRAQTLRRTNQLTRLNVALLRQHARLAHISQLDGLPPIFEKEVHTLDVSVDYVMRVKVKDTQA